jgi:hypothetical protein
MVPRQLEPYRTEPPAGSQGHRGEIVPPSCQFAFRVLSILGIRPRDDLQRMPVDLKLKVTQPVDDYFPWKTISNSEDSISESTISVTFMHNLPVGVASEREASGAAAQLGGIHETF